MEAAAGGGRRVDVNARCRHLIEGGAAALMIPVHAGGSNPVSAARSDMVAINSLDDMVELLDGVDIGTVALSFDGDAPAPVVFALFLAAAQRRGVSWSLLRGRVGHDLLAGRLSSPNAFTPARSAWLSAQLLAFCAASTPHIMPVSVGAYRLCEGGATPGDELSAALAAAMNCLDGLVPAGHDAELLAPRLSFILGAQGDLFEVVAKCRAARLVWARVLRERFGVVSDAACAMHLGVRLPAPADVRTDPGTDAVLATYQLLAAALGGAETVTSLPAPLSSSATWPLRAQQVIALESGLADAVDPLGGSYFLERLTSDIAHQVIASLADVQMERGRSGAADPVHLIETLVSRAHDGATVAEMWDDVVNRNPLAQRGGGHTGT